MQPLLALATIRVPHKAHSTLDSIGISATLSAVPCLHSSHYIEQPQNDAELAVELETSVLVNLLCVYYSTALTLCYNYFNIRKANARYIVHRAVAMQHDKARARYSRTCSQFLASVRL